MKLEGCSVLMTELIAKKRDGGELSAEEIRWMLDGFMSGAVPDYQMSSMLMAIYLRGMSHEETTSLTLATRDSGEVLDLSQIPGVKADKHSTGGVGDKVSLILCPMTAAAGLVTAKMSGRGLGHTGGTVDKLESFKGFSCEMTRERFLQNAREVRLAIAGQTEALAPADKLLYALRDVTGTVESLPLITASIMGKKLASGADVIVLDVKCGAGAFMKTPEDAFALARTMVDVGTADGKLCRALITKMGEPLGRAVGNAIEVCEAIEILSGGEGGELLELCIRLGSEMLILAGAASDEEQARSKLIDTVKSGAALSKLAEFVKAQGGDASAVYDTSLLPRAAIKVELLSETEGFVASVDALTVGRACMLSGAGRAKKGDPIDYGAGIYLHKKTGEHVKRGEKLATIWSSDERKALEARERLSEAYIFSDEVLEKTPLVLGRV